MPIKDQRTMNDLFLHPSLHPCRTGWETRRRIVVLLVACSKQARTRRRGVWMRTSFLFIHPNLCNSITVSKRPAGWRMNATHGWANNESPFHTSIYPSISNGMWKRMVLWIHISSGKCQTRRCYFPSVFSLLFSSNFVECELCRVDVDGFCFRCKRKKISFYSTTED